RALSAEELHAGLLLAAAVLVILPLLPDRPLALLAGLNLRTLWMLALLVMAIQSLGHVALRLLGPARGLTLAALCSSSSMVGTATFAMQPILLGAAVVRERRRLGRQVLRFPTVLGWAGKPSVFLRSQVEVCGPACLLRVAQGAAISASVT
ncbi:membrane protein, partial [mine drainage metagenome]